MNKKQEIKPIVMELYNFGFVCDPKELQKKFDS